MMRRHAIEFLLCLAAGLSAVGCRISINQPPSIVSLAAEQNPVYCGQSVTVRCAAGDADGDSLVFSWYNKAGSFSSPEGGSIIWMAPGEPGAYSVTVTVDDGRGGATSKSLTMTVVDVEPIYAKVFALIMNPILESHGSQTLTAAFGWNSPDLLIEQYIRDIYEASHGNVVYEVTVRVEEDLWPQLADGFVYTDEQYLSEEWHEPWLVDYQKLINDYGVVEMVENGEVDEFWLFGGPYFGFFESCMAGEGAVWCNGPVVHGVECSRAFFIMGFNYERGVDCMLENLGHRAEALLTNVYGGWSSPSGEIRHMWDRFSAFELGAPGQAACGNVHFAPNSLRDYDWGNTIPVLSSCDDWLDSFPDLTGVQRTVTCEEWGNGDMRLHHLWWFRHFPHYYGLHEGDKQSNWWKYVVSWNEYRPR